jgi:hypothetical protein
MAHLRPIGARDEPNPARSRGEDGALRRAEPGASSHFIELFTRAQHG